MSEPSDKPASPERIERLLRRWGAEQAASAEQATLGEPPGLASPVPPSGARMLRGSLLAAAASILFCAAGAYFFLNAPRPGVPIVTAPPPVVPTSQPADPRLAELAAANDVLAVALATAQREFDEYKTAGEVRLVQLQRDLAFATSSRDEALKLASRATTQSDGLIVVTRVLQQQINQLTELKQTLAAQLDARKVVIDRLEESLRAARPAMIAQFQPTYLGGEGTMAARQAAIKRNRLTERLAAVRKQARDEDATRTIDQLEVWLTRIELLDAGNASAARALAGQVPGAKLVGQIEGVLLAKRQAHEVDAWLLECELVLLNIEAAG